MNGVVPNLADLNAIYQPGDRWRCDCNRTFAFGVYAVAHWNDALDHACPCGVKRTFRKGRVTHRKEPKK